MQQEPIERQPQQPNNLLSNNELQEDERIEEELASQNDIKQAYNFTEFINTVKYIRSEDDFKHLVSIEGFNFERNSREDDNENNNDSFVKQINVGHFRQLVTQFFYLLYSCSYKKIVPIPHSRFLCYGTDTGVLYLCLKRFVTEEGAGFVKSTGSMKEEQYQDLTMAHGQETATTTKVPYFDHYVKFIKAIEPFWRSVEANGPKIKAQTMTCEHFIKKLQKTAQMKLQSQKDAFSTFEKAQFFIQNSILLRIRNSSVVCVFQKNLEVMRHFQKHAKLQQTYSQEYNEQRKRKKNIQKILECEKKIEKNIQEFFLWFENKRNPKYFKVQHKSRNNSSSSIPMTQLGLMSQPQQKNSLVVGLKVYELIDTRVEENLGQGQGQNTKNMQNESNPPPPHLMIDEDYYNLYEIEYCSTKSLITVKMTTDILLDWASSDSILFKWNTLTFETSNVGLDSVERMDQKKNWKKYVVIRGTSYFNKKEPILQKILTLVDLTMATYKSIELDMKSQAVFAKNLSKVDESYAKINHYMRVMHKSCVQIYEAILRMPHQN